MRKEKGITLIGLVVTIVVLLILAGVSISMLTGENGIITQAQDAKEKTDIAEEREKVELAATGARTKNDYGEIIEANLEEELNQVIGERDKDYTLTKDGDIFTVTYTDSNRGYQVDANGKVTEIEISIKLTLTHENKELNADELPNVKEVTNEHVPIPEGFYDVGGTKDDGVVISDIDGDDLDNSKQGNQFVWVPVNQNQKLTLEVESKENITEIVITQPDGEKSTISASGKTYKDEITMTKNGVYEVEVKTATTSKMASKRVSSLYAQDVEAYILHNEVGFQMFVPSNPLEEYNTVSELLEYKGADSLEILFRQSGYPIDDILEMWREDGMNEEMINFELLLLYMTVEKIYVKEAEELTEELIIQEWNGYLDNNQNLESVNKYGGYYIGRYEAGDGTTTSARTSSTSDTNTLVSKKGAYVYNYISSDSAKSLSNGMYSTNGAVTSQLITGAGWDRVLNWIIETGEKTEKEVLINSTSWGNYSNSTGNAEINSGSLNTTGRSEYWKANNIYDLAGNAFELTQETYQSDQSTSKKYCRGGCYGRGGSSVNFPAGSRYSIASDYEISFRTQLYINI